MSGWEPSNEWESSSALLRSGLHAAGFAVHAATLPAFQRALSEAVHVGEVAQRITYYNNGYRIFEYVVHNDEERAWLDRLVATDAERRLAA